MDTLIRNFDNIKELVKFIQTASAAAARYYAEHKCHNDDVSYHAEEAEKTDDEFKKKQYYEASKESETVRDKVQGNLGETLRGLVGAVNNNKQMFETLAQMGLKQFMSEEQIASFVKNLDLLLENKQLFSLVGLESNIKDFENIRDVIKKSVNC